MRTARADENDCIFCALISDLEHPDLITRAEHIVSRDGFVTAFVSSHQWPGRLPNVLVVPNVHYRDVFELPVEMAPHIQRAVRRVADALTAVFGCEGVTIRQNNRGPGGQDVFHHHTHVMARYLSDPGYPTLGEKTLWDSDDLGHMAQRLRAAMGDPAVKDFHRSLPRKRMGAGVVLRDSYDRVLIVKPTYKSTWEIPGGAVEDGESPWQACRREVAEELGLEIGSGRLLCVDYNPSTPDYLESLMFVFHTGVLAESQIAAIELATEELSEYRFVERAEALELLGHRVAARLRTVSISDDPLAAAYLEDHQQID